MASGQWPVAKIRESGKGGKRGKRTKGWVSHLPVFFPSTFSRFPPFARSPFIPLTLALYRRLDRKSAVGGCNSCWPLTTSHWSPGGRTLTSTPESGTSGRERANRDPGDTLLVFAARDGDRQAFGRLYDRYVRMVHGIVLARVPRTEVDDLVHDVFLHALRRLPKLRDAAAFGGWLAAIARNRATDYHRRKQGTVQLSADAAEGAGREDRSEAESLAALAAIRSLPEAYRETLILRLVEGMTGPEIAARTGLTPGSVRVNLHRGMQQLRETLACKRNDP